MSELKIVSAVIVVPSLDRFGFIFNNKHTNYRVLMMVSNSNVLINMTAVGYEAAPNVSNLGVSSGHIAEAHR
jgi:hypothetical protein